MRLPGFHCTMDNIRSDKTTTFDVHFTINLVIFTLLQFDWLLISNPNYVFWQQNLFSDGLLTGRPYIGHALYYWYAKSGITEIRKMSKLLFVICRRTRTQKLKFSLLIPVNGQIYIYYQERKSRGTASWGLYKKKMDPDGIMLAWESKRSN